MPNTLSEKRRNRHKSIVCREEDQAMDPLAERHPAEFSSSLDRLLTVEEVARILHVSPGWVYDHIDRKQPLIQSVRLGKAVRFRLQDVQKFIEAMMRRIA